jgi:hypothetical protein
MIAALMLRLLLYLIFLQVLSTATAPGSGWWCFSSSAVVAASGLVLTAAAPA